METDEDKKIAKLLKKMKAKPQFGLGQVPTYGKTGAEAPSEITEDEMNKFTLNIKYEQIPNGMYKASASIK